MLNLIAGVFCFVTALIPPLNWISAACFFMAGFNLALSLLFLEERYQT